MNSPTINAHLQIADTKIPAWPIHPDQAAKIINEICSLRIAVVGDFCLDVYLKLDTLPEGTEISLETGLPVRSVTDQRYSLGGAGNVAANLVSLGCKEVHAFGVIGNDPYGHEIRRKLNSSGIRDTGIQLQHSAWDTCTYTKLLETSKSEVQETNRIDYGNHNQLENSVAENLLVQLTALLPNLDAVIINEQLTYGLHSQHFQKNLTKLLQQHPGKLWITDSRNISSNYINTILKLNENEVIAKFNELASSATNHDLKPLLNTNAPSLEDVLHATINLSAKSDKPVFVTRGEKGCIACGNMTNTELPGIIFLNHIDPVGAGDAFLAGITSALALNRKPSLAAAFGTLVAGVTVPQLQQTGTATPVNVKNLSSTAIYRFRPEKAHIIQKAEYYQKSNIEIVGPLPKTSSRYFLFDHDGTISTLHEGWEKIMQKILIKELFGDHYASAESKEISAVRNDVNDLISRTTGIPILGQMKEFIQLINRYGFVKQKQIKSEAEYKSIYNEALANMVRQRKIKLDRKELDAKDVMIKGVQDFLSKLHDLSLPIYLASGTDEQELLEEAEFLGYAHLFNGICGARNDSKFEAKRHTLEGLMQQLKTPQLNELVTFGDGPVEIRETKKVGGIAVGIACIEKQRTGLDLLKRTRLIEAGADIIISDYSEIPLILKILGVSA